MPTMSLCSRYKTRLVSERTGCAVLHDAAFQESAFSRQVLGSVLSVPNPAQLCDGVI